MKDRYTRVTAPAGFDGQATRRDYYFKTRNAAREFRLRIKRWKAEQKYPSDTLSFDDTDKRWRAVIPLTWSWKDLARPASPFKKPL
jgi:hypothetical protein